jgi:hypothetical protein
MYTHCPDYGAGSDAGCVGAGAGSNNFSLNIIPKFT